MKAEYEDSIIYLLGIMVAVLPLVHTLGVAIEISPDTTEYYNYVDGLKDGAIVYVELYTGIRGWFEQGQSDVAVLKHIINKIHAGDVRGVVIGTTSPEGPVVLPFSLKVMAGANVWDELEYGTQFVWLGWIPGFETAQASMAQDFRGTVPTDKFGTPIDDLSLLDGITKMGDFDMVIVSLYGGQDAYQRQWTRNPSAGRNYIFMFDCGISHRTAAMSFYPEQIQAFMTPVRQTSEYEKLLGYKGLATSLTEAQLALQFFGIGLIIVATGIYWYRRLSGGEAR
ncbi:hypothetical protein AC482_03515 [miscellaneous Crenarchaeota group-15 archaeon DG-45]|uniref:Uncharacterized protein n=1 Tax=miscellaneous Crenarchaeota group-15 archaeon DG-45 TaxID=1685127 RepID=A0A0M0BPT4_9ARCH|nr:MAG: hypothetical protein AC482_03515 [miscellaneous Crenarchaeota group-15 archaeon DG-45]